MNIFGCMKKIFDYSEDNILTMPLNDFYRNMNNYNFNYEELVIILGVILNRATLQETKKQLNLTAKNKKEDIIIDFASFAYVFIGDEYNDPLAIDKLKVDLSESEKAIFIKTLKTLINDSSRIFNLSITLGNDNDRANMFAVNALLNLKRGLGFDNFHITLFTVYQSLELKLKHCLKKYIDSEPTAQRKQINFHNLVRLIKLISTSKVNNAEVSELLLSLREYLRYFEKINPGGQAARYEAAPNLTYFNDHSYFVINEKQLLENFVHALTLLQTLYLKLIEIYDRQNSEMENKKNYLDENLKELIGAKLNDDEEKINDKLRNLLDHQIFGDYQELLSLSYQELIILRFLIRVGFMQSVNQAVNHLLKKVE